MSDVTKDLRNFGYRELDMAGDLLKALGSSKDNTEYLGDGVEVWFNLGSGCVFLSDEDYNTAMMNGDSLEDWLQCGECGTEGFMEDIKENGSNCCHEQWGITEEEA